MAKILDISLNTAGTDLKKLCAEGLIAKIEPSAAPALHYFELKQD